VQEIKEALNSIHPFDILDEKIMDELSIHTNIGYYKKKTILIDYQQSPKYFYIILKGRVLEIDESEEIVDIYDILQCKC